MTKYVINSGSLKKYPDRAEAYFSELFKGTHSNPRLLRCFFATLPNPVEDKFKQYLDHFSLSLPRDKTIIHECGQVDTFREQAERADVVYLHGGSVAPLMETIGRFEFEDLFKDTVVGTNSASTVLLSAHGWSCDSCKSTDGLGVWPAKVIVHYMSDYGANDPRGPIDWTEAKKELEAYGDTSLPVYALEEGDFVVFEK